MVWLTSSRMKLIIKIKRVKLEHAQGDNDRSSGGSGGRGAAGARTSASRSRQASERAAGNGEGDARRPEDLDYTDDDANMAAYAQYRANRGTVNSNVCNGQKIMDTAY